jgi:hypothetical protein
MATYRKLLTAALILTLVVSLGAAKTASAVSVSIPPLPHLVASMAAEVSPKKLPPGEFAPVTWSLFGKFATSDGGHPPALREVEVNIDRDVKLNTKGFPVCRAAQLEEQDSKAAKEACRAAFLGEGKATVEIASAEGAPVRLPSRLLVFNGGERGGTAKLLIHTFLAAPSPTAAIARVSVQRRGAGLHAVSKLPVIADGMGSLIDFKFTLGKTRSHEGRKVGYLEARCPDGIFKMSVSKLLFKNEAHTPGEAASTQVSGSVAVPCTSSG